MAGAFDMMRERLQQIPASADRHEPRARARDLTLMSVDARLAWLTAAPEAQLLELAEYFVDRLRAADWMQRLREAQAPDLATLFDHFTDAASCRAALERARITLVLTSHPSELRPPHVLTAFAETDVASTDEQLTAVLQALGGRLRTARPLVTDEVDALLARAQTTLFDGLRDHILRVRDAWETRFGTPDEPLPLSLRLHTWVGADRDGNPAVTAAATLQAGLRYARAARETYARWLAEAAALCDGASPLAPQLAALLEAVRDEATSEAAIIKGLEALSLAARAAGRPEVEWPVYAATVLARAAGLHLLTLEWRENSAVILRADAETARGEECESERISAPTRDLLASLCAVAQLRREHGARAVEALIVSNCEGVAVLLALRRLASACGVFEAGPLDIVPLLESIDALRKGPEILEELFAANVFDEAGEGARYCQIMLGYSDAAKDGGRFMADACIRRAQRELAEVCARHGALPLAFHGRGGSPARGEAGISEAFAELLPALPPALMKQTEQGEVIANRYGHTLLAAQHFDRWLFEALDQQLHAPPEIDAELRDLLERLAQEAFSAYRALRNDPNFLAHLMAVTPLLAVCRMPLGSRPAARVEAQGQAPFTLERLRAIPLNLAANAAHLQMPAWYGTGRALAREIGEHGAQRLRRAYREHAPLRSSLDRAARALAATDFSYVNERADLSGSDQLHAFVADLHAEAERLKAGLLLLGIPLAKRTPRDDMELVFLDLQRALHRRARVGREVSFELEALVIAAASASNGVSG